MTPGLFLRAACAAAMLVPSPGFAARAHKAEKPSTAATPAPPAPAEMPAKPAPPDSRPYDPQLMRLAELLGALTTMRQLCGADDGEQWRGRMQALLDAEGSPPTRRDRLAGAYNRGLQGYGLTYRACTPNARLVIERFLDESARLARDVASRYRAS